MNVFAPRTTLGAAVVGLLLTLASPPQTRGDEERGDWPMFGHDPLGTRFAPHEKDLSPANVAGLNILWQFPTQSVVSGTPVVAGDTVFAGDTSGNVYAVRASDGKLRWQAQLAGATFTATATVLLDRVVIGDQANGYIYGLDQDQGRLVWKIRPNTFGRPAVWGSGTVIGRNLAIGIASNDEGPPPPFLSRGSLVLLDPRDGRVIWQTYTVSDAEYAKGSTGCSVWTTPAYDRDSNTIYVGTGNNFTQPPSANSDAIMAFDADTGQIKWSNQRTKADVWTPVFPTGPDADFGDSPQLYTLPDGRKVVGDGQKNGVYHVLDAATGKVINAKQFLPGSLLGGMYTDSAVAGGMVFAPGNNLAANQCSLFALKGDATGVVWQFTTTGLETNGVAVANGVVYFKPSFDPNLYALDMNTGVKLAAVSVGGSNSGISISRGRLFVGLGNILAGDSSGGIVALGLPVE